MSTVLLLAVCASSMLAQADGVSPSSSPEGDVGPLVRALWLVHRDGTAQAVDPRNDERTKGALANALGKGNVLTAAGVEGLIEASAFAKLAGSDGILDAAEVQRALESDVPESR